MASNDSNASGGGRVGPSHRADETPISSSGVVLRKRDDLPSGSPVARRRRDSDPPSLTPYQARLDVEMDDTAVSKVRDPSVSIRLGSDPIASGHAPKPLRSQRLDALASVALGAALGALFVVATVVLVRALLH